MKALRSMEGVQLVDQDPFIVPVPDRQVLVVELGDFWGEAMATALLSMCFLAGQWSGFSVNRLREEMEMAQREEFRARNAREYNAAEQRWVRREKMRILILSALTLGVWWLLLDKPWPRPHLRPVEVPHIPPAPFSPQGLSWLLKNGYIRREDVADEWLIFPEPKLVRETRWLWDPSEES